MATVPLTVRGLQKLRAELQQLKGIERHAVIQAIAEARAQGDLSENAEYHAAKEQQGWREPGPGPLREGARAHISRACASLRARRRRHRRRVRAPTR